MNSLKINIYCKLPNRPASDSWLYRLFSTDPTLSVEDEAVSRKERNKKKKEEMGNLTKLTYSNKRIALLLSRASQWHMRLSEGRKAKENTWDGRF